MISNVQLKLCELQKWKKNQWKFGNLPVNSCLCVSLVWLQHTSLSVSRSEKGTGWSSRSLGARCRNSIALCSDEQPHIGNYRLLKTIGKGNFAKVKLARHILTGREVGLMKTRCKKHISAHKMPEIEALMLDFFGAVTSCDLDRSWCFEGLLHEFTSPPVSFYNPLKSNLHWTNQQFFFVYKCKRNSRIGWKCLILKR